MIVINNSKEIDNKVNNEIYINERDKVGDRIKSVKREVKNRIESRDFKKYKFVIKVENLKILEVQM